RSRRAARESRGAPTRDSALLPVWDRRRAAPFRAVVRPHEAARGTGARRGARAARALHAGAIPQDLRALAREHQGLVHLAPAMVGPPDSGLVLPGRQLRRSDRRAHGSDRMPALWWYDTRAGSGRARYL